MVKRAEKGTKLIKVPTEIVERLMVTSNKRGDPFYGFVAQTLEQALRVYDRGNMLKDVVDFHELMEIYKSSGAKIVSDESFNYLISKIYPTDKDSLHEKWYGFGRLCGKSLMARYENPIGMLERFLAETEWNLNEVEVMNEKGKAKIRCVSPILSVENTELITRFIDGIMYELGYKMEAQDCVRGIISLEYVKP
jgi:hypothetical protein